MLQSTETYYQKEYSIHVRINNIKLKRKHKTWFIAESNNHCYAMLADKKLINYQ